MKVVAPVDNGQAAVPVNRPAPVVLALPRATGSPVQIHRPRPLVQALPPERPMIVQGLGSQGPAGLSAFQDWLLRNPGGTWEEFLASLSAGSVGIVINFTFGDVASRVLFTMPEDGTIPELQLTIRTPFDGTGATLAVRTSNGIDLIPEDRNFPEYSGTYETTPMATLPAGTEILLEIYPGSGATQGNGLLTFTLY